MRRKLYYHFSIVIIAGLCILGCSPKKSRDVATSQAEGETIQEAEVEAEGASKSEKKNDPLLLLVNKDTPLPKDYDPDLKVLNSGNKSVAEVIYNDLRDMLTAGNAQGLSFCIASGYRSAERQQEILDQDIRKLTAKGMDYDTAYQNVTRTVMPAGYSEHETGLAVDITALSNQMLDETQVDTPENRWLRENCSKYGFILRYPEGKEEITKIDYEPWHFRYVGKEAAREITEKQITLEEYLK
ncbi:hypothetical protein C3B58_02115 [Lactonifactor longoviformis]|uniref:D-alanyl-D-alanine carboxypeptidase n=1 Tax=Lactonifactor longoviformis DSM 17459 TaxID=1122155 RepID=A0A1M4T5Z6_9CLOT|nr:M15 family metallopeptidase [Lactonifactor longoviformis]POP34600.1 hypothetical protein C3B58_02115 [Lactonifactor longoviformis]SHE39879.1 D-alanyl-D-alanine carboxypeptidase [Lactonifactor longoviformis DSM 17459]